MPRYRPYNFRTIPPTPAAPPLGAPSCGDDAPARPEGRAKLMAWLLAAAALCASGYSLGYQRGRAAPAAVERQQEQTVEREFAAAWRVSEAEVASGDAAAGGE